jgi:hypothetical protein
MSRNSRKREVRKLTTIQPDRMTLRERKVIMANPEPSYPRPATRGDCQYGIRPCPYVACRFHLYLDIAPSGGITLNFPDLEPDELVETCALDVADEGGATLEVVGELMNVTRERTRQIEEAAKARLVVKRTIRALHDAGLDFAQPRQEVL